MKPVLFALMFLLVCIVGCVGVFKPVYHFNIEVKNVGSEMITNSKVVSEKGFFHEPGVLIPGARKIYMGPIPYPYRDQFTVTWKTAKGQEITKALDLTKAFPKPLKGTLVFTIDEQNNLGFQIE